MKKLLDNWFLIREKLWFWILSDLVKYPENQQLNFILKLVRFLIMPINTLWHILYPKLSCYDPLTNIYTINGVRYSGYIFSSLGFMKYNQLFMLIERKDGVITIKEIRNN